MNKKQAVLLVAALFMLGIQTRSSFGQAGSKRKTIWDGVYTAEQAARGKAEYEANCARCHGRTTGTLTPALTGNEFMERWREDSVESLFRFMRDSMPLARRNEPRIKLADTQYIDIIGYVLQTNALPAGTTELKPGALDTIRIEGKDGPKPVPNGALILTVGCLTQVNPTTWSLTMATEPGRSRTVGAAPEDLKAAEAMPAGTLTFRLQNLDYLGADFIPADHAGHKMFAKGILIRQPNAERLDIRSMQMVSDSCGK